MFKQTSAMPIQTLRMLVFTTFFMVTSLRNQRMRWSALLYHNLTPVLNVNTFLGRLSAELTAAEVKP